MISVVRAGDRAVEEVDVVDDLATDERVVGAEVPDERLFELGDLGSHPRLGHLGEDLRVPLAVDHRLDHLPRRLAPDREATEVSLMPASWRTFSRRWISLARASTWVLR